MYWPKISLITPVQPTILIERNTKTEWHSFPFNIKMPVATKPKSLWFARRCIGDNRSMKIINNVLLRYLYINMLGL